MSIDEPRATPVERGVLFIQWGPIVAGAVAAAALALVLHSFGAAIGVSVGSTAPTWRDASIALVLLSGIYLILVAIASYGLGGYVAGRARTRLSAGAADEVEFRDGTHGLMVWAIATLLTGLLAFGVAQSLARLSAPSGGPAGASTSVAGENIIAYDLDRLFRSERRSAEGDFEHTRAEAARILLTAAGHRGMAADDRAYLARVVAGRTGLAPADAERRVDEVVARARENIRRARASVVLIGFMAGAAALIGAAIAWFAAAAGGRHRDAEVAAPFMTWAFPRTRLTQP
jgi:hypothetical protein